MASSYPQSRFLTLKLQGLGRQGETLAEVDGKPVFVFGGIPGETVVVEVIAERRGYVAAQVTTVIEASAHRVEPACRYFGECTGCQWQHLAYERQLEMKREIVGDTLQRIAGIDLGVLPTLPSPSALEYRNHARFTVSKRGGRLGFVHKELRKHIEIEKCLLMAPWINSALESLQGNAAETSQLALRVGVNTGSYLLQPTFHSANVELASGQKYYEEIMLGRPFRVSSPSFFQVNTAQAERMAELVMDQLCLDGTQIVVDAYAGVATFAVLMSTRARKVFAVEESSSALADARVNVEGIENIELRQGKTEDILTELASLGANCVVLDPPRAGCMPATLDSLIESPPERIVYVSCEPETLARDLVDLTSGPFRVEQVQPVDMFPQTHHIETVTTLVRDDQRVAVLAGRQQVVLASASPRRSDLLRKLGFEFIVAPSTVVEPEADEGEAALELAETRALAKARDVAAWQESGTIIGADTVVEFEGSAFGKPRDDHHAREMLRTLRGREHRVITSVVLLDAATGENVQSYRESHVRMRDYSDAEIEAYVASGDPFDKAGGYAVQSDTFAPATHVRGCYLNVVGLPVCTTLRLTRRFGLRTRPLLSGSWPELDRCQECSSQVHRDSSKRRRHR